MRLQSFLSKAGVTSRRNVFEVLEAGKVKVNGEVVRIPSYPIFPDKDQVMVDGHEIKISAENLYFMFHKPKGVISSVKDTHGRKTVLDFFQGIEGRLYPVGRLDQDTTGLLILTNDGHLTNRLTHPRFGVDKIYDVVVDRPLDPVQVRKLEGGVIVEGRKTAPCRIRLTGGGETSNSAEVILHEGRKRQIRLMFKMVGYTVQELHRKKYGDLTLGHLKEGEYRLLTPEEIKSLQAIADKAPASNSFNRPRDEKFSGSKGRRFNRGRNRGRNRRRNRNRNFRRGGSVSSEPRNG